MIPATHSLRLTHVPSISKKHITIKDVATLAGVSIKTVSRVINREPNVRPTVKASVTEAIRALGYVPNRAARSLAGTRSFVIGTIFDNPSPSYIVALQRGAMAACRDAGYHLTIDEIDMTHDVGGQITRILETSRMDGLILSPPVTDSDVVLSTLEDQALAYVRLAPSAFPERSHAITIDDAAAAAEMAHHLWHLGHRHFALISGPETHGASALRLDGFLTGIKEAGGNRDMVRVVPGDFTFRAGMVAGLELLSGKPRPTAIFASNDDMAAGVYGAASRLDLRIPDDVSVTGFDDSAVAERVWPPLTTIRQPVSAMAAEAARILIEGQRGDPNRHVAMTYTLIVRQSTGTPPTG